MKISVVIPCYNSEKSIKDVVYKTKKAIQQMQGYDYEFVLVNDCSNDGTFDEIRKLALEDCHIIGLNLANNTGQHNAIIAGFHYVTGDYVMVCCDDGQTPSEMMQEMIVKLDECDVVCVNYENRPTQGIFRKLLGSMNDRAVRWLIEMPDSIEFSIDFMAKRFVIDEMKNYDGPYGYLLGLMFRTTQKVGNVSAPQHQRKEGKSGYTIKKLVRLWVNQFTTFSIKPLRISAMIGFLSAIVGCVLAIFILGRKCMGFDVQLGWSSLMVVMLISSGILMVILGIIGEYLGRIYMCINKMPQYVIKEALNIKENE